MMRFFSRVGRSVAEAITSHIIFIFWTILVVGALAIGYAVLRDLKLDADRVAAVSGAVAAVAGALAAIAALGAARQSSRTARDAARALALATKPAPELRMNVARSAKDLSRMQMEVQIENLSTHAIRGGRLEWLLRDGTRGSHPIGSIRGRMTPFGGMIHRPEGVEDILVADVFDGGVGGVDRVTLDYWGEVRETRWRNTLAMEFEVREGYWSEVDGVRIPDVQRISYERDEVEL